MKPKTLSIALALLLFCKLVCAAEFPTVKAGPYFVSVNAIARILDFSQPVESQRCTQLALTIKGDPMAMQRVLELAQEPIAHDDLGNQLSLLEVRFPGRGARTEPRPQTAKVELQVLLSAAASEATNLMDFSAHLIAYEKKDNLRLDFIYVAGEKPSSQMLDNLVVTPELLGPQDGPGGKIYGVVVEIRLPEGAPDTTVQWENELVELIDAEGHPKTALSTSRTFKYDDKGAIVARILNATFAPPAQPPRGLRYRVERLRGVQALPYRFEQLPLP